MEEFDYVVAGGGTAGCVVAARLSEDPDVSVCLLEAGPSDVGDPALADVGRWAELVGSEYDWDNPVEPQPTGNDYVRISRAKVLGGSSSHNTGIAFWPPREDLDEWMSLGCAGWGADECLALLAHSPVHVRTTPPDDACAHGLLEAASSLGLPTMRFNTGETVVDGGGWLQVNVDRDNTRMSASRAYLHPVMESRRNLDVRTGAWCTRVLLSSDLRARGVEYQRAGQLTSTEVLARREVIVSCGAIDTPKLLMLSGIGPPDHLREHGISVALAAPGVGANLQDHVESIVQWQARRRLPRRSFQDWPVALFSSLSSTKGRPELMIHYGSVPFDLHTLRWGFPTTDQGFSLTPNVCRPFSKGTVRLRSGDFRDLARVDPRYLSDPDGHDLAVLLAGVRLSRRIVAQPAMDQWRGIELTPGSEVTGDEELADYVRRTHGSVFHPVGTARMGGDGDPQAVLDERLKVRGTHGLRVADAAAMPFVPAVNPCLTVMLIAERCARMVREAA